MASFLSAFRPMAPDYCKHAIFLERYAKVSEASKNLFLARARAAKALKSVPKMTEAFSELIKEQLLCANVSLVIENVPDFGIRQSDNLPDRITAKSIHDTMWQFGSVRDAVVFKNHAYVWFDEMDDAYNTHSLINQMKMGDNLRGRLMDSP
tara:strand:+ start:418 stop:870 length:453 start_codon:yes stop_codon:yes gene_type:complete